jgi:hypothetical protein
VGTPNDTDAPSDFWLVPGLAFFALTSCGGEKTEEVLLDEETVVTAFGETDHPLTPAAPPDRRTPDICTLFLGDDPEASELAAFFVTVFRTGAVAMDYDKPTANPGEDPAADVRRVHNVVIYLPKELSGAARSDIDAAQRQLEERATMRDPDSVCP